VNCCVESEVQVELSIRSSKHHSVGTKNSRPPAIHPHPHGSGKSQCGSWVFGFGKLLGVICCVESEVQVALFNTFI